MVKYEQFIKEMGKIGFEEEETDKVWKLLLTLKRR